MDLYLRNAQRAGKQQLNIKVQISKFYIYKPLTLFKAKGNTGL